MVGKRAREQEREGDRGIKCSGFRVEVAVGRVSSCWRGFLRKGLGQIWLEGNSIMGYYCWG